MEREKGLGRRNAWSGEGAEPRGVRAFMARCRVVGLGGHLIKPDVPGIGARCCTSCGRAPSWPNEAAGPRGGRRDCLRVVPRERRELLILDEGRARGQ